MTAAGLWLTVAGLGLYHGLNPAMGWPLAVSTGLMGRGRRDLAGAVGLLALGHLLAMGAMLLPLTLMIAVVRWQRQIRVGAAVVVMAWGVWLLVRRRHPRFMARIRPTQLALWSFTVATAHGAGLMLVPIYLGICRARDVGGPHQAVGALIGRNLDTAVAVSIVHTGAMVAAGGLVALLVHDRLGLRFLSKSWFNLEVLWASSLLGVGAIALAIAQLDAM